jgi:hypothetical protein
MLLRRTFDGVRVYIDTVTNKVCVGSPGRLPPPRRKFQPIEDVIPLPVRRFAMAELAMHREDARRFTGEPEDSHDVL